MSVKINPNTLLKRKERQLAASDDNAKRPRTSPDKKTGFAHFTTTTRNSVLTTSVPLHALTSTTSTAPDNTPPDIGGDSLPEADQKRSKVRLN